MASLFCDLLLCAQIERSRSVMGKQDKSGVAVGNHLVWAARNGFHYFHHYDRVGICIFHPQQSSGLGYVGGRCQHYKHYCGESRCRRPRRGDCQAVAGDPDEVIADNNTALILLAHE